MQIDELKVTVGEVCEGYFNDAEEGVVGYDERLDIRPKYQREFVYKDAQRDEVIRTVMKGLPLNVIYWCKVKKEDGSEGFEVLDGQQRTISLCEYVDGTFSVDDKYFYNLPADKKQQILDYPLFVYVCDGTDSEKLEWFRIINIAGEELTDQELRNAVYAGSWTSDAKRYFSKTGCAAGTLAGDYLKGASIRQEYLETAIFWAASAEGKTIEAYMAEHQNDPSAVQLWNYFRSVIDWVQAIFPKKRKEMKGLPWGIFYNQHGKRTDLDPKKLETEIQRLMGDEDVTKKSGIYEYLLTGEEKKLSIRSFDRRDALAAYEKQGHKLNDLGITVKGTSYDIFQDKFQEDENCLFNMVKARYLEHGYGLSQDKEESIRIDVRSIIMVYRERQGQTATRLQNAKHIMLTSNNAIANVSKKYESNRSIQAGHIPACISADLFGAILWLNSPIQMQEYQKQKLLADCYAFLKPNKVLLEKYIQSLDEARAADKIDEKTFLFLRTHKVVLDSLMDITQGDYARFNSNTYLEVYDDIQSKAQKRYRDEAASHEQTRKELEDVKARAIKESSEKDQAIQKLVERVQSLEDAQQRSAERAFEKKVNIWGWVSTLIIAGIPYVVLIVGIEIAKTKLTDISWKSAYGIAGAVIATAVVGLLFTKTKKLCFQKVRQYLKNRYKNDDQN